MTTIKVWPTKASAVGLKHPNAPILAIGGTLWPRDSFTGRRLADGSVTEDETKVHVAPPEPVEAETTPAA